MTDPNKIAYGSKMFIRGQSETNISINLLVPGFTTNVTFFGFEASSCFFRILDGQLLPKTQYFEGAITRSLMHS